MVFRSRTNIFISIILVICNLHSKFIVLCDLHSDFHRTNADSARQISEIHLAIFRIQDSVSSLKAALAMNTNPAPLRGSLWTIEQGIENIKNQISAARHNGINQSMISASIDHFNILETQFKALKASIEYMPGTYSAPVNPPVVQAVQSLPLSNRPRPADTRVSQALQSPPYSNQPEDISLAEEIKLRRDFNLTHPSDTRIVEEIRNRRFSEAQRIFMEIDVLDSLPNIIRDVYANSEGNIDLILDFAKALTKVNVCLYVLGSLWYEMQINGHRNPYKMMTLANYIQKEVIDQSRVQPDTYVKAQQTIDDVKGYIVDRTTDILKNAMYSDGYRENLDVKTLANAVDDFSMEVSDDVMRRIVFESYPTISADELAENVYSHKYITQIVLGLVALYKRLEDSKDLNNKGMFKIAEYLSRVRKMENFKNIHAMKKLAVNTVIERIPSCAKNLFLTSSVCVWNKGKSEYLYAASSQFNWNTNRRSVFTRSKVEPASEGVWYVEKFGDQFYFKSKAHENEYLYADTVDTLSQDKRLVLTWIDGGYVGDKSAWNIELDGDYCYLRNENFNEYLLASDSMHREERRFVFTQLPGKPHTSLEFQWQIRTC